MLNRVEIIGNLGKDPEVNYLDSGVAVAKFRVAVTESYKDKKGEKQSTTEWFRVELWRGIAEVAEKCLHKGDKVFIAGKQKTDEWEDKDVNTKTDMN